jgi:hypothetical protein
MRLPGRAYFAGILVLVVGSQHPLRAWAEVGWEGHPVRRACAVIGSLGGTYLCSCKPRRRDESWIFFEIVFDSSFALRQPRKQSKRKNEGKF